jgi:hypothetical protein
MTNRRLLSIVALSAAALLPAGPVLAQTASPEVSLGPGASAPIESSPAASEAPPTASAIDDERLAELEALVPSALAGLPLGDNLRLATGEELIAVMSEEESAIIGELLDSNDKTVADYAAAITYLPLSGDDIVVIQAHRINDVPAARTIDTWVEILTRSMAEPTVSDGFIGGRAVTLVSDAAGPDMPLLHLFPNDDVMWMMVAADQGLVESFIDSIRARGEG